MTGDLPQDLHTFGSLDGFAAYLADLARQAAAIALRHFRTGTSVREKGDGSPVTMADIETQRFILDRLRADCPGLQICAEEDGLQSLQQSCPFYLLVDPLDGTKEFVKGSTEWTVNLGLVQGGRPVAGAVSIPAEGLVYWGGTRAWMGPYDDAKILSDRSIRVRTPDAGAIRALCSRDHKSRNVETFFERLAVTNVVAAGSSLKMLHIAAGEADLYPRLGPTMAWDTAAAHAVLRAAGGEIFRCDGTPLTYDPARTLNPSFIAYGAPRLPPDMVEALSGLS